VREVVTVNRSLQVYRVTVDVLVEASTAQEASEIADRAVVSMDESELWSAEMGAVYLDEAATRDWRRRKGIPAEDLRGFGRE